MCWNLFFLLGPLCACALYLTVVRPLGLAPAARWWTGLCLAAFSLKFTWFSLAGGSKFVPEMPAWTIHVLSVAYDFVLILAAFGVAWAIARQVAPRRRERPGTEGGNGFTRRRVIAGALACVASGTSVKDVYDGRRLPDVVEVPLEFPDLPPEFDGYRVAQISDLHVSAAARADRTAGVVRLVNACDPDLIAITGDVVDGMAERRMVDVAPLAGLRARDGVVGCTGNHEYYGSGWNRWRVIFRDLGMRVLENERMLLRRGDATLAILGENDPVSRDSGIHAAAALVPDGAFRILLAHRPTRLAEHAACACSFRGIRTAAPSSASTGSWRKPTKATCADSTASTGCRCTSTRAPASGPASPRALASVLKYRFSSCEGSPAGSRAPVRQCPRRRR